MEAARRLLEWISELDPDLPEHQMVLVAAAQVPLNTAMELHALAGKTFGHVDAIRQNGVDVEGWPAGPNSLFRLVNEWMRGRRTPFLLIEPDCVPMRSGWLNEIAEAYASCGKPFMGCKFEHPKPHINGCCVYPVSAGNYNPDLLRPRPNVPWDMMNPLLTLRYAAETPLICRMLREPVRGAEYTFPDSNSLTIIPRDVCLFHGCRDGSLIARLRERNACCESHYEVVLPDNEATCYVCLGRYGDAMNALPLARLYYNQTQCKPHFMIAREFASLLDGIGYVVPHVFEGRYSEMKRAMAEAQAAYRHVVPCQVFGTPAGDKQDGKCYNLQSWVVAGEAYRFEDPDIKLVFDRRDKVRERALVDRSIERSSRPIMAVSLRKGNSSPFNGGNEMTVKLKETFGEKWQIIDLCDITAERIYDLLGIMEQASILVTSDTAFVHLAGAIPWLPVYLLSQDHPWSRTEPRCRCVGRSTYSRWEQDWKAVCDCIEAASKFKVFHTFEVHPTNARGKRAQCTWPVLWNGFGWVPSPLKEPYERDARSIGDERSLPYIKDILKVGLGQAEDNDIIVFSNDDIILLPGAHKEILTALSRVPVVLFSRRDIKEFADIDRQTDVTTHQHFGRDVLVSRAWFLRQYWDMIPDFIIGRSDWDTYLTCLFRKLFGCIIPGKWGVEMATTITATEGASTQMLHELHSSANARPGWGNRFIPHAGNLWNQVHIYERAKIDVPEVELYWCQRAYQFWKEGKIQFVPEHNLFRRLLKVMFK
jgi:hypothetical protein